MTTEEGRLLNIADAPVVMAVRRETFGPEGVLLDVVDAVYDARCYSYQAEISAIARRRPQALTRGR